MKTIIVRTQAELDALPDRFDEYTVIEIRSKPEDGYIQVTKERESSRVEALESSRVVARGSSSVVAWESSSVEAWESSRVEAWGSSSVVARESSRVVAWGSSSVVAWGSSSVEAWGSSSVEAWGSSSVVARESSRVVAWESSRVEARESSRVVAWESSSVEAWESSRVVARESSRVEAWGSSSVEAWGSSSVEARESSRVVAWGSSSVEAWGSSSVEAWGSSSVVARESSRVVAWESSRVEARESSRVVAWGSSSVEARESSRVVAWGSSRVEAWGSVGVHLEGVNVTVLLYAFAVCWKKAQGTIKKESETATIIEPITKPGVEGWCENEGVKIQKGKAIIFKRVSKEWQTQEGTKNETIWKPGKTLEHHDWRPKEEECGEGKYHACSTAYFCDEFRSGADDRYVAMEVDVKDMYAWPNPLYPHKIAFRKCKVLYECDRWGEEIETKTATKKLKEKLGL